MVSYRKILRILYLVFHARKPKRLIEQFVEWGLSRLTPSNLKQAIDRKTQPIKIFSNEWHLGTPIVQNMIKLAFRRVDTWPLIEESLTTENVYNILCRIPENKVILDTPEGKDYIYRTVKDIYNFLYTIVWE